MHEPATSLLDESFAPSPRSDNRFARQDCYEPPAGFRQPSFGTGEDRKLSGPSERTLLQIHFIKDQDRALLILTVTLAGCQNSYFTGPHFHCASSGFNHQNARTFGRLLGPCFETDVKRPCYLPRRVSVPTVKTRCHKRTQEDSIYLPVRKAATRRCLRSRTGHPPSERLCAVPI